MARYRRRYRKFRKSGRWSTRLTAINVTQLTNGGSGFFIFRTLATNPAQDDNTVSQRFTVKNVNCQVNIEWQVAGSSPSNGANVENLQHYILYIPQGFTLSENTPFEHPEWIMAHRLLGSPQNDDNPGYLPSRISTRLARKLDTGDRIVYLLLGSNTGASGTNTTIRVDGLIKLNTKAN